MSLVTYSDSEGSGSEDETLKPQPSQLKAESQEISTFSVHKSNARKIQVRLSAQTPSEPVEDGQPALKKARIGEGALSVFNSMLPPPKRDSPAANAQRNGLNRHARKVFSLRTSAEPAFSRDAYLEAEEWDEDLPEPTPSEPVVEKPWNATIPPIKGNPMVFKPLSVTRNPQKNKKASALTTHADDPNTGRKSLATSVADKAARPSVQSAKVSLFSPSASEPVALLDDGNELDRREDTDEARWPDHEPWEDFREVPAFVKSSPGTLADIASDLNLTPAARRQLLGRNGKGSAQAINVVNFNTDTEYAANEEIRATGEQVQHNPVRAIAPGKHSLKQLVNAASGQKEALEESFASGKRNKKEAGSRYGW